MNTTGSTTMVARLRPTRPRPVAHAGPPSSRRAYRTCGSVVARALTAPGMVNRLELPHTFRVAGVAFLLTMALGHLPALFALPAGLGDIATGIAALLVARTLAQGRGHRAALWLNAFGMTDLVVALTLGAPDRIPPDQRHPVRCADQRAPARADPDRRRAAPVRPAHHLCVRTGQGSGNTAASHRPAHCRREIAEKRMQPEMDALTEPAAWPGAGCAPSSRHRHAPAPPPGRRAQRQLRAGSDPRHWPSSWLARC